MKELVAPFATLIFVAATFGMMIHVVYVMLSTGTLYGLAHWLPVIAISSLAMAATKAPCPLCE